MVLTRGGVEVQATVIHLRTDDVAATKALAAALATLVQPGDVLVLSGDLGAGKTAFTQGFGAALGVTERITSPTFTLVHEYDGQIPVHHVDVYRMEEAGEVFDLALPEMLDDGGVTVVEWGNLILPELPRDYLDIRLSMAEVADGPDVRLIVVVVVGSSWTERSNDLLDVVAPWVDGSVQC